MPIAQVKDGVSHFSGVVSIDVATGVFRDFFRRIDLYKEAASQLKMNIPSSAMRSSTLFDGKVWDGSDPKAYADSFKIKA